MTLVAARQACSLEVMTDATTFGRDRLVVGIDGSDHARRALVWAMEEAALRGAALDVVMAWHVPATAMPIGMPFPAIDPQVLAQGAKETLECEIDTAERETAARPRAIRPVAVEGSAAAELVRHSADADLLVVGARGVSRLAGMLLGSVSSYCVRHATVPVVVVPAPR
jgi:nucleotide-binding universal stress UspA family protein